MRKYYISESGEAQGVQPYGNLILSRLPFTPHLSVGQFSSPEEALAELPQWHPVSFTVESVALISRRGDEPFEVRHIISLGSGEH